VSAETSYNGWPASRDPRAIHVVPLVVRGVEFIGGCKSGDVHTVLSHVLGEFHDRVEHLKNPGCWGYSYRPNRNNPDELSCHASATAADANAPAHPNGVEAIKTFTPAEIAEVHEILREIAELDEVVHWGGDWHEANGLTPDAMHFEIHDHDLAKLARVAARIKHLEVAMSTVNKNTAWARQRVLILARLDAAERAVPKSRKGIHLAIRNARRIIALPRKY